MGAVTLNQDVTYWVAGAADVNGSPTFAAAVTVKGRWARKDGIATDENGNDQKTELVIYTAVLIPKRSRIVLGVDVSATPPAGSRIIMDISDNPSMTDLVRHKA